jgi:hypothetical protein
MTFTIRLISLNALMGDQSTSLLAQYGENMRKTKGARGLSKTTLKAVGLV